jgi:MoxR-like ATPase
VFLDEIWKAGPSIQNALLTVINEKIFRNGDEEIKVPMKALISASNELPAKEQGLEALWDRFLVRLVVENITDVKNFNEMISEKLNLYKVKIDENDQITEGEYGEWSEKIDYIIVPENIFNVIHYIRSYINEHNKKEEQAENKIYVSDRRWRKIVRLLRTSAFLNDRKEVDLMDCFLISHCIWNEETQIEGTLQFVKDAVEKYGYTVSLNFDEIDEEIEEFKKEIDEDTKFTKDTRTKVLTSVHNDYYEILKPLSTNANLIAKNDFNRLTNQNQNMRLVYWDSSWSQIRNYSSYNIKKDSNFTIFINDTKYSLKTTKQGDIRTRTQKPNEYTETAWDKLVDNMLLRTSGMVDSIEKFKSKDLEHIRTNLFVSPELANIVESHITETLKRIEKIELEVRNIQNNYKNLEDQEIVEN